MGWEKCFSFLVAMTTMYAIFSSSEQFNFASEMKYMGNCFILFSCSFSSTSTTLTVLGKAARYNSRVAEGEGFDNVVNLVRQLLRSLKACCCSGPHSKRSVFRIILKKWLAFFHRSCNESIQCRESSGQLLYLFSASWQLHVYYRRYPFLVSPQCPLPIPDNQAISFMPNM